VLDPGWKRRRSFLWLFNVAQRKNLIICQQKGPPRLDDVIHGLERNWTFDRPPEFNEDEWQWKYRIATESIDGDEIVIVIAVDTANRSFEVVTRWK
jgi:hypothetical protein